VSTWACCDKVKIVGLNLNGKGGERGIDLTIVIKGFKEKEDHREIPTT